MVCNRSRETDSSVGARVRSCAATPAVIACVVALGACAHVQPTTSWPELQQRLSRGAPIAVTETAGSEVRGRLEVLSSDRLTLNVDGTSRAFDAASIREVRRDGDSLWSGLAWGAAVGAAGAVLSDSSCSGRPDCGAQIPQRLTFVAVMAAAGAGVDALHRDRMPVYHSPSRTTTLTVIPTLTPRRAQLSIVLTRQRQ
jgi:hypothetical protein